MRMAVFAGATALAMMGPLFVSEQGIGPSVASAQDSGNVDRLLALMDQFTAAGFESNRPGAGTITPALDPNGGRDHLLLSMPNQMHS